MNKALLTLLIFINLGHQAGVCGEAETFWKEALTNNIFEIIICQRVAPDLIAFGNSRMMARKAESKAEYRKFLENKTGPFQNQEIEDYLRMNVHGRMGEILKLDSCLNCSTSFTNFLVYQALPSSGQPYPFGSAHFASPEINSKWLIVFNPAVLKEFRIRDGVSYPFYKIASFDHGVIRLDKPNHLGLEGDDLIHDIRALKTSLSVGGGVMPELKTALFARVGDELGLEHVQGSESP